MQSGDFGFRSKLFQHRPFWLLIPDQCPRTGVKNVLKANRGAAPYFYPWAEVRIMCQDKTRFASTSWNSAQDWQEVALMNGSLEKVLNST